MNVSIKDLLKHVSTGQKIRLMFLYDDGEETGSFLEFENALIGLQRTVLTRGFNVLFIISPQLSFLRLLEQLFYLTS